MTIRTMASKPSISKYNDQDHIFYSKYGKTHSDIYAIPIVEETRNVFDYCSSIYNYNGVFVPDERARLMKLNLNPVRSKVSNGVNPVIRFLYTGREYNVETGNYYYRMRMMDSSVGRFSSKDPIVYLNLYRYVRNNPLRFRDRLGLDPQDEDEEMEHDVDWMCENWGSNPPTFGLATATSSGAGTGTIQDDSNTNSTDQTFFECTDNCTLKSR